MNKASPAGARFGGTKSKRGKERTGFASAEVNGVAENSSQLNPCQCLGEKPVTEN